MRTLHKPYQVWTDSGGEGFSLQEYDTLEECLTCEKYTSTWYITKRVDIKIEERTDDQA